MNNKNRDTLEIYWNEIKKLTSAQKKIALLNLFSERLIKAEEDRDLQKEAAYLVCDGCNMFFEEIMPGFEEIMDLSCDLELPDGIIDGRSEKITRLKNIIEEKKQALGVLK